MQIEILENGNGVRFVHRNRRGKKTIVQDLTIFAEDSCSFTQVGNERVYLLQFGRATDRRFFFWLQDIDNSKDAELARKIADYVKNPGRASSPASGGDHNSGGVEGPNPIPDENAALLNAMGLDSSVSADAPTSSSGGDALSNILNNLSSTAPAPVVSSGGDNAASTSTGTTGQNTITLADLQGAMASLATQSPVGSSGAAGSSGPKAGPPLDAFASTNIVEESGILEDEAVRTRLMELLPDGQQTEDGLRENLTSPQVRATLRSLTQAVASDSFNSVLANFQLQPEDGALSLMMGNPIQAFLDCLLKQIQREKEAKENEVKDETKDEEESKEN